MTMRLVKKAKVQKTRWVFDPKRALMTCRSKKILLSAFGPCNHLVKCIFALFVDIEPI